MDSTLTDKLADLNEVEVLDLVRRQLDRGQDPMAILQACQKGMVLVGKRYEQGKYFISDLMMSGEIFKQISTLLAPRMKGQAGLVAGRVVIGTVAGDIHDIGKDLVVGMLRAANYEVIDLGVDVPIQDFVDAVKRTGAKVVGLSCLLTTAYDSMKETVAALKAADLGDQLKVMIGGGPVDEKVRAYAGGDAWGADAQAAVHLCQEWI